MDPVRCYMVDPNGRRPHKLTTRPRLPQASAHCPVLQAGEDGSRVAELLPPPGVEPEPHYYQSALGAVGRVFHSMHSPVGSVRLLGNCWFKTPEGWDSIWMGVTNHFDPPVPHAYTVRVQTDWYAGTPVVEILYQLRIGERLKMNPETPMSMVVFVPREEPSLEFAPDSGEMAAETVRQVEEKYQPQYIRAEREMSPYNIWYSRHQR